MPEPIVGVVGPVVTAVERTGFFAYIGNTISSGWNNKICLDAALTQVQTLLSYASHLLNECPQDHGFDETSFGWFSRVLNLITDFESWGIVKKSPTKWISVGNNIRQFSNNRRYKPANLEAVSLASELDWRASVHRAKFLIYNAVHIGKKSKELLDRATKLINDYDEHLKKDFDEGTLYKKEPCLDLPLQTQMNSLVSIASDILDHCPTDSGFDGISFDWFVRVMQLIDQFETSKIVVSIPDPWSRARKNIKQFSDNGMYRPAAYTAAPTAPNWQPLVSAEGATSYGIKQKSEELARVAGVLKKDYDDKLEKEYKANTLFKKRPRCQLPHKICDVTFVPFHYRSETMKKLYRSLHDSEPRITLVYGPGGIGKTTILVEMAKRAEKENMFSSVVYAEVSRNQIVSRIQDKIASQLAMSPLPEDNNRRSTILEEKMNELGRVLVILDDVWENANILREIGIPFTSGVKVLVGTRRRDLSFGEANNKIRIDVLSEKESWTLLCQVAPVADTYKIKPFAEQVRDECCGLPLALVVIGKALAGKVDDEEWKRAVHDLKNSIPTNLEGVESALYKVIQYSYDHLPRGNKITRTVFLHCCLFPELEELYVADLQRHLDNNEEVKSLDSEDGNLAIDLGLGTKIAASINTLEHYGLLEKRCRPRGIIVKMHDVVRDVAVFIARGENYAFIADAASQKVKFNKILRKYKRMSLSNINKDQDSTDWPELHTLLIRGTTFLSHIFSKKLESSLAVLDLSGSEMTTLPSSMETLKNVQTLLLNGCKNLSNVAVIVKLKRLKVLSLRESVVKSLPENMKDLLFLEVLYWENALPPKDTDPKVTEEHIQDIRRLNELSMDRSITVGAFLAITKLKHLTAVKLYVSSSALSSAEIFAGENHPCTWEKFTIYNHFGSPKLSLKKNFNLSIEDLPETNHGVQLLLRKAEEVVIKNCFQNATRSEQSTSSGTGTEIVLTKATGKGTLRKTSILRVMDCANISYLTSKEGTKLTELEEIELTGSKNLIGIFEPHKCAATGIIFGKVRKIIVNSCNKIKCVIPNDVQQEVHNTLEVISVRNSKRVQYIFHPEANCSASFSKLTSIELDKLEMLSCIWNGTPPHEIFKCLKELIVRKCNKLTSIFTTHMAAQLKNLQKLTVEDNSGLTEIVSTDGANAALSEQKAFECVTHLSLQELPNLKHFNSSGTNYDWPALVKLYLRDCPVLTKLPIGRNSAKCMNIIDLHSENDLTWYKQRNQEILDCFDTWVNGEKCTDPGRRNSECSALHIA